MGSISGKDMANSWLLYPLFKLLIILIYIISHVYDYVTYPIWYFVQKPWRVRLHRKGIHAKWDEPEDGQMIFHSTVEPTSVNRDIRRYNLNTMEKVFSHVVGKFNDRQCMGTREILGEEKEVQPDGKVHSKFNLGDYHWRSYRDFGDQAEKFGRGLREIGVESKARVVMFAESRAEWMIAAYGCFQHSLSIVTLYTNLGDDGITHGISETEVSTVICSWDTHVKLLQVLTKDRDKMPYVQNVVIMEDLAGRPIDTRKCPEGVKCIRFKEVVAKGDVEKAVTRKSSPPGPDDIAIIMYTSGSTGKPKGVMLSHHNLVSAMGSLCNITDFRPETDRFIAFLPLAHVLELLAESSCLFYGIKIGYSSSLTLTTKSSKVKNGCKGDSNLLKPTLMCAVPLILERIYKSMVETMKRKGWFVEELFHYLVAYKMKWQDRGFDTPLLNKTLFRRIRYFLGGKVRVLLSGGAPLASDTHSLCRTCLSTPVIQGYGLTETASCATVTHTRDRVCGRAGAPLMDVDIKLVDWEEGNYRVTDKPNPRGEVHVGGDNVAVGYYNNKEETEENFYEENGRRWFKTGDIGEFDNDGVLKIIDRRKDLVKLQAGEYVSYGRTESILKTAPIVESICAYADPARDFIIAVVIPDKNQLKQINPDLDLLEAINDREVKKTVVAQLKEYGIKNGLKNFEIPARVLIVMDEWTPDNGLVTAAFKIRRKFIYDEYKKEIDNTYNTV
eukprot:TRINITY_DN10994_c0_g1_i1.p1 TRINITY_DN10994_c0_g1~~TRINITY_DN10994_c0_g1_i1.p1  ORF type:complete len:726 (-),score=259.31 TRINITY_DN10994_c0_g1_i1:181-2358(-)